MQNIKEIISIALPVPLRKSFDYLLPEKMHGQATVGARVLVPFGKRELIGVVVAIKASSNTPENKLKVCQKVFDTEAIIDESLITLAKWISNYYFAPLGMVLELMMPKQLRLGKPVTPDGETIWQLTDKGAGYTEDNYRRSKAKKKILSHLQKNGSIDRIAASGIAKSWRVIINGLVKEELLKVTQREPQAIIANNEVSAKTLTQQQSVVVGGIAKQNGFNANLVYGVTGSGKTEVYLSIIEQQIKRGGQALILVPEIGLTPQLIERVRVRLSASVTAMHSGLTDKERHLAWWRASNGKVDVVLGTRTAVFTPFKDIRVIVVDEEHDLSFKQQDGVRYHARDVALVRARNLGVPIVLGSATPALETLSNAQAGRYHYWELSERATGMDMPDIHVIDTHSCETDKLFKQYGLSPQLVNQITERLAKQEQSLLFLNRRGFAPTMYCPECAYIATCQRCNMPFTRHNAYANSMVMRCHHCGYDARHDRACPICHQADLLPIGLGTQRIEDGIAKLFPSAKLLRVDRDALTGKGELDAALQSIRDSKVDIVIGTQLLTKGHDFPNVTLVGILDADKGLYSADFRASERIFQQVLQVAGRAGRHKSGQVYIQTQFPNNEVFAQLQAHDYQKFAATALAERQIFAYPPAGHIVLLRAESVIAAQGLQFLRECSSAINVVNGLINNVSVSDPVPAPMEKLAGRFRAQLMLKSPSRVDLHKVLQQLIHAIETSALARKIRWSLDVDPVDMY